MSTFDNSDPIYIYSPSIAVLLDDGSLSHGSLATPLWFVTETIKPGALWLRADHFGTLPVAGVTDAIIKNGNSMNINNVKSILSEILVYPHNTLFSFSFIRNKNKWVK